MATSIAALLALPLLAGCGGSDQSVTPREAAPSAPAAATALTVTSDDGPGAPVTWQLTCDPVGGTHPDPAAACAALAARGRTAMAPVPPNQICTQQFGGEQTATVRGTWRGEPVEADFARTNGCEISRWKLLEGLLPAASA